MTRSRSNRHRNAFPRSLGVRASRNGITAHPEHECNRLLIFPSATRIASTLHLHRSPKGPRPPASSPHCTQNLKTHFSCDIIALPQVHASVLDLTPAPALLPNTMSDSIGRLCSLQPPCASQELCLLAFTDRVFVHALNTVKRIPRTGSARPPPAARLKLYGLYKQSMEGDVSGVMRRPTGDSPEETAEREKWYCFFLFSILIPPIYPPDLQSHIRPQEETLMSYYRDTGTHGPPNPPSPAPKPNAAT